jgi:hypothetical protein
MIRRKEKGTKKLTGKGTKTGTGAGAGAGQKYIRPRMMAIIV